MNTALLILASFAITMASAMADENNWRDRFEVELREKDGHKLPYRLAALGEGKALPLVVFWERILLMHLTGELIGVFFPMKLVRVPHL